MERYLEGGVALVTGGFTGIGLAIAGELPRRAAAVGITMEDIQISAGAFR